MIYGNAVTMETLASYLKELDDFDTKRLMSADKNSVVLFDVYRQNDGVEYAWLEFDEGIEDLRPFMDDEIGKSFMITVGNVQQFKMIMDSL